MKDSKKAAVKNLQELCGYLNFLCKAIFPGRPFIQRMYAKYSNIVNCKGSATPQNTVEMKWKQHYHVRLDTEFHSDCEVWIEFLSGDLQMVCNQPMVDLAVTVPAKEIGFYSDASASKNLGFGATMQNSWIKALWNLSFIKSQEPSIEYLELYALVAGVITWKDHD